MESGQFGCSSDVPIRRDEFGDDLSSDTSLYSTANNGQTNNSLHARVADLHNGQTEPRRKSGPQHVQTTLQNEGADECTTVQCYLEEHEASHYTEVKRSHCTEVTHSHHTEVTRSHRTELTHSHHTEVTHSHCTQVTRRELTETNQRSNRHCSNHAIDHRGLVCNGDITEDINGCPSTRCRGDVSCLNGLCIVDRTKHHTASDPDQTTVKVQVVRPKTISWSRTVKQRKEKREKDRKKGKQSKDHKDVYIYPELCSSSDEELDDYQTVTNNSDNGHANNGMLPTNYNGNSHLLNSTRGQDKELPNLYDKNPLSKCLVNRENESLINGSVPVSMCTGSSENCGMQDSAGSCTLMFNPHLAAESDCILAPLAVPEDSGGSSVSSNSDLSCYSHKQQLNDSASSDEFAVPNANVTSEVLNKQYPKNPKTLNVNNISCEENLPNDDQSSLNSLPLQYSPQTIPLPRPNSNDSLDEVGDYIETDFPSKASRLLFACSSNSSSTSSDSDEGYGVNSVPRVSSDGHQNKQNLLQANTPPRRSDSNEGENRLVLFDGVPYAAKACDKAENNASRSKDCVTNQQTKRLSRLGSSTGKSESGSEIGGQMGSDSSVMYSPEIDFMEFMDSDLPTSSSSIHQPFAFNGRDNEILQPFLSDGAHFCRECVGDGAEAVVGNELNECRGVEASAPPPRNNLNYERCYGDFEDGDLNLERYDPYLHVENENFHYLDQCKQEKVPKANFQNSESNRQEKVFYKVALEKENCSSSCSSEDEENIAPGFVREVVPNVEGQEERVRQNSNSECMYLEDLENLTHALQNAVIMQLPPKLEESSGDSSDDPIYEEIESLESFLSSSDNSLHMVKEETIKTADNVARVLPKFERRKRRGSKPHCFIEKVMIWNEYEAYVLQVKQIGTSACGPTAILNVMKAFDYQVDKDDVCKKIHTNMRMEAAPIPYYLFARSTAGTTSENLVDGINKLTNGTIRGRFFHFFPPRKVELLKWLGDWMKKGAVPIATLNLQRGVKPGWTIPDAWHHQMVYGVSSKGVYLTNPLEIVAEETIMEQLTSDSVLLVRRQDVVNRFRDWAPLNDFLKQKDQRWQTMNVLGQVVNVLREACTALSHQVPRHRAQLTSHITIPAAYKAGITMFARHNSDLERELFKAPELEIKECSSDSKADVQENVRTDSTDISS